MNDESLLSFSKDIRPLFTDLDVEHMKPAGIDLSSRDDVVAHADAIYETVQSGSMPPASSGEPRWTERQCARFKQWQTQGCPP
jgi:uncharacterized membrane protein